MTPLRCPKCGGALAATSVLMQCPFCTLALVVRVGRAPHRMELTRRERAAKRAISAHLAAHGSTPQYDELLEPLGVRSKAIISRLVHGLEAKGHLECTGVGKALRMTILEPAHAEQ
jgi:hypothetical protein